MKGCKALDNKEVKAILENLSIRDKVFVMMGLTFGTRISEALELRFKDVAGDYLYLKSKKGSDNAAFPIPDQCKALIAELRGYYEEKNIDVNDNTFLFLSRKGENKAITRQQASQIVKVTCGSLGIPGKVNTHSFRKSFVTKIYEMTGFNIAETKNYSRHKSLANLDYYINTTQKTELINNLTWG